MLSLPYNSYRVPTLFWMKASGRAALSACMARQPVQCPGTIAAQALCFNSSRVALATMAALLCQVTNAILAEQGEGVMGESMDARNP